MKMAPKAKINDGLIDVLLIRSHKPWHLMKIFERVCTSLSLLSSHHLSPLCPLTPLTLILYTYRCTVVLISTSLMLNTNKYASSVCSPLRIPINLKFKPTLRYHPLLFLPLLLLLTILTTHPFHLFLSSLFSFLHSL